MRLLQKRVICLVETGWEGTRKLSLDLAKQKIPSACIIKGRLGREVLEIITKYQGILLISMNRGIFKLYILLMFLKNFVLGNTLCIVMDSKKNYPWVSKANAVLGIKTILLREKADSYTLLYNQQPRNIKFILNMAKKR